MKKIVTGMLACLFLLTGAGLASPDKGLSGYGPILGFSLAKQCEKDFDNSFKLGLALGGFVAYKFNSRLSFIGQLLFVQKGFRYSDTDAFGPYDSRLTLSYLELPILARYTFGSDTFQYFALAGPAFGLKLGGKFSTDWDGESYESTDMSHYKGMDLGLVLGAGVGYPLCSGWLLFDVRFTFGLLNIYADPDPGAAGGDTHISNTAILFLFSYIFGGF
ncbi:MAG TPA: porin family protein [Acidobacteriota bacterium]